MAAKVTEIARSLGIFTEAELGKIVRIGSSDENDKPEYTTVEDAVELVGKTGVNSLAPAIGTAHGMYKKEPSIQFDRLKSIAEAVKVPLVLHGGSGIPDEMIRRAIGCGIRKVNVGTELKYKWSETLLENLSSGEKEPIALSGYAIKAVEEVVCRKIRLFGSGGRAAGIFAALHSFKQA
jgi:fructose/tagatose bisphosphate aldolase